MAEDANSPAKKPGKGKAIGALLNAFEAAAQVDEDGVEFWSARTLAPLLGYEKYANFLKVVEKAKEACVNSGESIEDHFADAGKMVSIGSGAEREIGDIEFTRFAFYLVAQNGDPAKPEIAAAQTYFAVQTRRQETADKAAAKAILGEDEKRVLLRNEMKEHNKSLASAAKGAGVAAPLDYAVFQNQGYKGLYGGLDLQGIKRRKKLTPKQDALDHMPSGELAANLFRATQTEEKLKREAIKGKDAANRAHHEIGAKVRQTIKEIGGTMPEDYPAIDHVKEARKRLKTALSKKLSHGE